MDWKLFLAAFGSIFVAELGDKTQLACVMMAAESKNPWVVFLGASLALICVSFLGVLLAQVISQCIAPHWIKRFAASGFILLGVLIFFNKI